MKKKKKEYRYWLGYLRVSRFKQTIANVFTSQKLRGLYPIVFWRSKKKEAAIFNDPEKLALARGLKSNPRWCDFTISRYFFYKD